ncbi:MAG: HlyD family type I secretion periplasmic adaptor subunit [Acetobacteraceae bacterium]|nr:HlyD family type I secretion periplasmic adaptor subunit [Acetobacteraceae bacterium]
MRLSVRRKASILSEVLPFQTGVEAVEEPPAWMRRSAWFVASLFVLLIVIASVAQVDMVVEASGELSADRPTVVIQPIERSIIRTLNVRPGDVVKKGQVLATLDPTFTQADTAALVSQRDGLAARVARLKAELEDAPVPAAESSGADASLQATLYRERRAQYSARLLAIEEAIGRDQAALQAAMEDAASLTRQAGIARDVENMRSKLFALQTGSRLQLLDAQSATMRAERELQTTTNRVAELRHDIEAKRAEREAFISGWRGNLLEELARDQVEFEKTVEAVSKAARLQELVAITAPEDGVVLEVANRSSGSVLREAEPLMSLVPTGAGLVMDARVDSKDVGYVREGDPVTVKVDAFPYQRHGALHGRVRSIGQESVSADHAGTSARYHRIHVTLDNTALHALPDGVRPMPGMTATAEIAVGTRRAISYFLYPVTRGFQESIREP